MSTMMHVLEAEVEVTLQAMALTLGVGAPLLIGLWGGERRDVVRSTDIERQERLFSLRTAEQNEALFSGTGPVEHRTTWSFGSDEPEYQVFLVRVN